MKAINKLWKCFNNPILHKFEREISFNDLDKIESKIKALEIIKPYIRVERKNSEYYLTDKYSTYHYPLKPDTYFLLKKELEK